MGLIDNIRGFFSGSRNTQTTQPKVNEEYEKSRLANRIVDLVGKIKRINSFDSSIWNLSNVYSYELMRKSLDELQRLNSSLENRLLELEKQEQKRNSNRDSYLEECKWTGQKPKYMSDHDFDVFQRSDDGR